MADVCGLSNELGSFEMLPSSVNGSRLPAKIIAEVANYVDLSVGLQETARKMRTVRICLFFQKAVGFSI